MRKIEDTQHMNSKKKNNKKFKVGQSIKIKKKNFPIANFTLSGTILRIENDQYYVAIKKCENWIIISEEEIVQ